MESETEKGALVLLDCSLAELLVVWDEIFDGVCATGLVDGDGTLGLFSPSRPGGLLLRRRTDSFQLLLLGRLHLLLGHKPLAHRRDHLEEPVPVERVERQVASDIKPSKPLWHGLGLGGEEHHVLGVDDGRSGVVVGLDVFGRGRVVHSLPHVLVDDGGLPGAPDQTTGEEGDEEGDAIVELHAGSGHVELVAEPVDIEEGGRELVEDEGRGVEVEEGSLLTVRVSDGHLVLGRMDNGAQERTNPNE